MNTRFAPSPTGDMHIGNLRAAIMPYLYARKTGSKFLLRIDDTDAERSKEYYTNGIYEDLKWLGIDWDYTFKQSDRKHVYQKAMELCIEHGLVYESYDTEEELEEIRRRLHAAKKPPAYKREHARYIEGREKYWRFDTGKEDIEFDDLIKGKVKTNLGTVSDPVICKPNGDFTYVFTSIVDDMVEKISCIIRAVDHLTNTSVQLKMLESMVRCGLLVDLRKYSCKNSCGSCGCGRKFSLQVAHYPLFCGSGGVKFSKRTGNFSLTDLRATTHPLALFHYVTFLGSKKKGHFCSMEELIQEFDLKNYASSNLIEFNPDQLGKWQSKVASNLPLLEIQNWCPNQLSEAQWKVVNSTVRTKADIKTWDSIFNDQLSFTLPTVQDQHFAKSVYESISESDPAGLIHKMEQGDPSLFGAKSTNPATLHLIHKFTSELGKDGLHLLRKVVTGQTHGPKIDEVLDCMDQELLEFRFKNSKSIESLQVRFTNTLSGEKELFFVDPHRYKHIHIYACGPTVYYVPHIGNLRSFVVFDVLHRLMKESAQKVVYIRNITDIDDKVLNRAAELDINWLELTKQVTAEFHAEMSLLNLLPPTHEPKVTENIDAIVQMIQEIMDKGIAYVAEDGVYFSIKEYRNSQTYDIFGCTKHHAECVQDDFVLWKFRSQSEVGWDSPWGWGRPGWHIECSAMVRRFIGDHTLDIHCGGKDLIFPHHTNEVAQFVACGCHLTDKMADFWLHNNFVNLNSEKMSKSIGNMLRLQDINAHPMVLRLSLLMAHYRFELNWNHDLLREAESLYNKWRRNLGRFIQKYQILHQHEFINRHGQVNKEFMQTLSDDLNTPAAVRVLDKLTCEVDEHNIADILKSFEVLGISFEFAYLHNREIAYLVSQRQEFRKQKNFVESDKLRESLAGMQVELEETKDLVLWYQWSQNG